MKNAPRFTRLQRKNIGRMDFKTKRFYHPILVELTEQDYEKLNKILTSGQK